MKFLVLSVMVSIASCSPLLNYTVTPELITKLFESTKKMVDAGYAPKWIVDPIVALPDSEKTTMAQCINNYHAGKLETPKNSKEFIELLKKNCGKIGEVMETIVAEYYKKVDALDVEAKTFMNDWEAESYKMASPDRAQWFANGLQATQKFISAYKGLSEAALTSLKGQFPEMINAIDNCPKFKAVKAYMATLPPNYDFKDNADTMNKMFDMTMGEYFSKN